MYVWQLGIREVTNTEGRTVRLFLVDGSPTGLVTAEIMNWTGHALAAPRSRIGEALKRQEAAWTGVYCLVGDDPEQPSKTLVYIGEGDCVADRIKAHAKDSNKDFWTRACFITSKDSNLTKSHARYLESRLVEMTKRADRANLANATEPTANPLPESDRADMEFFLTQVQVVLPVVGMDFLRVSGRAASEFGGGVAQSSGSVELYLESRKHGISANALETDGEVTVLSGSYATMLDDFAVNQYTALRKQLIDDGRLRLENTGKYYTFVDDVVFASPSAAAAVIFNRNTNGRTAWRIKGTDQTLKDWQDAQIAPIGENLEIG